MVNRVVVVLGIVFVGVLAVGGLLAMVLGGAPMGGEGGAATPAVVDSTPLPPATTAPATGTTAATATSASAPTPTAVATSTAAAPTATASPTPARTTVPVEAFDPREIERQVVAAVNDRRAAAGLPALSTSGGAADRLTWMARNHSIAMADEGQATHRIDGRDSADRYRAADLYDRCSWAAENGGYLVKADNPPGNPLEAVGVTTVGQVYTDGGQRRFAGNDTAVARAVVESWWETDTYQPRLTRAGAERIGVGVELTRANEAFVTATLCG